MSKGCPFAIFESMRLFTLCVIWSIATIAGAQEVYRAGDRATGIEFSDTPRPGAAKIQVPPSTVVPFTTPTSSTAEPAAPPSPAVTLAYQNLRIVEPAAAATLRDNGGNVVVKIVSVPDLQTERGHRVRLEIDGTLRPEAANEPTVTLLNLDRGAHTLIARIENKAGRMLIRSNPVEFQLHRRSLLQPANKKKSSRKAR